MNELVKVTNRQMNGESVNTVNARDLHEFLQSGQQFGNWIVNKVDKYGFIEGVDFLIDLLKTPDQLGRPLQEYYITLDMAKQLAMVENNDKGKEARLYFIRCEKELRNTINNKPISQMQMIAQLALEMDRQNKELEEQKDKVERLEHKVSQQGVLVKQQVIDTLKEEAINEFPSGCIDLATIRVKYFKGISEANISVWLKHIKHPQREYKRLIQGGLTRLIVVFEDKNLKQAYDKLKEESVYLKTTGKNDCYHNEVIGNFRIKK